MSDFHTKISRLDTDLFKHVVSQTTENDKRSLLALQAAMRELKPFVYLEIGSYLGGSLQPYVVDPKCVKIISIDPRPTSGPDERGITSAYRVTTQDMLNGLRKIPAADLKKIQTIEAGTDTLSPGSLPARPDLCFIDGEHTDAAVLRDSRFCLAAIQNSGCLFYHDANIVYRGIRAFVRELSEAGRPFHAFLLSDCVFVIEVGGARLADSPTVQALQRENYQGYLWSLMEADGYRQFFNRPMFQFCRAVRAKTWDRVSGRLRRSVQS